MDFEVAGFDWDHGNRDKCRKHGVAIADIETMFLRPVAVFPDPAHSREEERFHAIGSTVQGRHVFVVFTLRKRGGATLLRPISARYMHKREVRHYEKETAQAAQRPGGGGLRRAR
ncbi:MAG TPA: BrnT family toxin [Xanthobacteraceae bacterium]